MRSVPEIPNRIGIGTKYVVRMYGRYRIEEIRSAVANGTGDITGSVGRSVCSVIRSEREWAIKLSVVGDACVAPPCRTRRGRKGNNAGRRIASGSKYLPA